MKGIIAIFTLVATVYAAEEYESVGCFADDWDRAISGIHSFYQNDTIHSCYLNAKSRGNEFFGVEYENECYTSPLAGKTYSKHGKSKGCNNNGQGGSWAINIYRVTTREYENIGCFKDKHNRAISGGFHYFLTNTIHNCYLKAKEKGYDFFGVEYYIECWYGKDASKTYNKYGESTGCYGYGRGGSWAIEVYHVIPEKENKALYTIHEITIKPESTPIDNKEKVHGDKPPNVGHYIGPRIGQILTGPKVTGEKIPAEGNSIEFPPIPSGGKHNIQFPPPMSPGGKPIKFPPIKFPPIKQSGDSPKERRKQ